MLPVKGKLRVRAYITASRLWALYDFTAADENQLDMKAGDVLLWNDGELRDDWILCSLRDRVGSSPCPSR